MEKLTIDDGLLNMLIQIQEITKVRIVVSFYGKSMGLGDEFLGKILLA